MRQLADGCSPGELAQLLDTEMETLHDEEHQPINLIRTTGDALPGLGIVAAVLGIIVTMGHIDGGPEVIGHHVAAALVGTFLGILMCYGMLAPIATAIEMQAVSETRYMICIKEALLAAARGSNPKLAIEFGRSAIFSDERPAPKISRKPSRAEGRSRNHVSGPDVIIIKKKAKGHAAHGAAWKVAYADFVTAMMALFMVLWLVSQTDQKIKKELSDYFRTGAFSGAPRCSKAAWGYRTAASSIPSGAPTCSTR